MPEVTVTVLTPGVLTSIQDAGRRGLAFYGIPRCGWLDGESAQQANLLVGNAPDAGLLECNLVAPRLKLNADCRLAVTGADMEWRLNDKPLARNHLTNVSAGSELSGGPAIDGARGYVAINGKLVCAAVHGSVATDLTTGIGGLGGHRLQTGDELVFRTDGNEWPPELRAHRPPATERPTRAIKVLQGPEWELLAERSRARLTGNRFSISHDSNRMAARLSGTALDPLDADMPSVPVVPGVVQLPPSGQLIVILQDGQTTGGYPRIVVVPECELSRFNQLRPGSSFRFDLLAR